MIQPEDSGDFRVPLGRVAGWLVGIVLCIGGLGGLLESATEDVLLGAALAAAGLLVMRPTGRLMERVVGVRLTPTLRVAAVAAVLVLIRFAKGAP